MFTTLNKKFRAAKVAAKDREMILESTLGVEEVIPGSDEEIEDIIDVDSVPEDAYRKLDAMLDRIVDSQSYDDTEAEELADEDFDEDEVSDSDLDAIIDESCGNWLNEHCGHCEEGDGKKKSSKNECNEDCSEDDEDCEDGKKKKDK